MPVLNCTMIAIHSLLHMKAKRHCAVAVKLPVQLPVTDDKEIIIIFVSYCGYLNEKENKSNGFISAWNFWHGDGVRTSLYMPSYVGPQCIRWPRATLWRVTQYMPTDRVNIRKKPDRQTARHRADACTLPARRGQRKKNVTFGVKPSLLHGLPTWFWLGDQCPLAAWGEENFENFTTKWCILKYIWINMWSAA